MWSKDKLKKIVAERQGAREAVGEKMQEAALLYARAEGMTDGRHWRVPFETGASRR